MTFRLPQNLSTQTDMHGGDSVLHHELLAEQAASLGRAGRAVEQSMARLQAGGEDRPGHEMLRRAAAEAVHAYLIQRELCGLRNHDDAIAHYRIPGHVLAIVGAR